MRPGGVGDARFGLPCRATVKRAFDIDIIG